MGEEKTLVLHGMWASPFSKTVELALKIKGIPFQYVEEDLMNKNPNTILKYNPVYNKLPILLHNGNSICESLLILEYIEEVWKNVGPTLLPQDPYKRAQFRFWAGFIHNQLFESTVKAVTAGGEALEKAVKEVREKLKVVEEHGMKELLGDDGSRSAFVNGEEMGFVDIVMWSVLGAYKIHEEVLGVKIIDENETPSVCSWLNTLMNHPLANAILPSKQKVMDLLQYVRNNALNSSVVASS